MDIKYIARDEKGWLSLFENEPQRCAGFGDGDGVWIDPTKEPRESKYMGISPYLFPEVTWEGGPRRINITLVDR